MTQSVLIITLLCSDTRGALMGKHFGSEADQWPIGAACSVALCSINGVEETLMVEDWKKVAPDIFVATSSKK